LCLVAALAGCWTEGDLVHGAFTEDQWKHLQQDFSFRPGDEPVCNADCMRMSPFGQMMFFEPRLSNSAKVSCATCHNTQTSKGPGWYVDTRADNAVSMGDSKATKRNTMTLVNVAYRRPLYGWSGECTDPATMTLGDCASFNDIIHDIALPSAMNSTADTIYQTINLTPTYRMAYEMLFGPLDSMKVQGNVERALDAYLTRLNSVDAPFDKFLGGNDEILDASATRGFAVFVGRGACSECHSGPMFTDHLPHVTGVTDTMGDKGRGKTGAFLTPSLRNTAQTSPYMHNGSLTTLTDVISFYNAGGNGDDYTGTKDPLMAPLDLTAEEQTDLAAFLHALTGTAIDVGLRKDTHVCVIPTGQMTVREATPCGDACTDLASDPKNCGSCGTVCSIYQTCNAGHCISAMPATCTASDGNPGQVCANGCKDLVTDPANCGGCGNTCMTGSFCMGGMCTAVPPPPPPMCPMPLTQCGMMCFDLSSDPMNCGTCGNVCPANKPTCTLGSCHP
jgi:cytochrome c peroxidase